MLQWNELRVTPDGKYLIVDVQVQEADYYEDVYIDSICFDVQDTFDSTGPSSKAIEIYKDANNNNQKHIRMTWDIDTLKDKLFFVYAIAKGTPAEDTPCGMKNTVTLGVVYNKYPIYIVAMKLLKKMEGCNIPLDLVNFFLRLKAFELCIDVGNYTQAIEYWKKFFIKDKIEISMPCGCYG